MGRGKVAEQLIYPRSPYCRDILLSPRFIVCHLPAHGRTLPPLFFPFPVVTPHSPRAAAAPPPLPDVSQ